MTTATEAQASSGAPASPAAAERHARAQYLGAFAVLAVLTLVEVGVALIAGIPKGARISALVLIAVSKASLIALVFMHLRYETRVLRWTVFGPLLAPAVYGLVLISDAAWRFLR